MWANRWIHTGSEGEKASWLSWQAKRLYVIEIMGYLFHLLCPMTKSTMSCHIWQVLGLTLPYCFPRLVTLPWGYSVLCVVLFLILWAFFLMFYQGLSCCDFSISLLWMFLTINIFSSAFRGCSVTFLFQTKSFLNHLCWFYSVECIV